MPIGYVMEEYPRRSESAVVEEVLAHERAGIALALFSLRPPQYGGLSQGVGRVQAPVSYLPEPGRELQAVALAGIVLRDGITHLHARSGADALVVARLAARLAGVGYSCAIGAGDLGDDGLEPSALGAMLADADDIRTSSEAVLQRLRWAVGQEAARARRIHPGVDAGRLRYRDPDDRARSVVAVGELEEGNGFTELVDACAVLACTGRAVDCRVVGAGPLEDDLRHQIALHGLEDRVRLVTDPTDDGVSRELAGADLMVAPYVEPPLGLTEPPMPVLHAMALGTPVIATRMPGVGEAVQDEETGVLVRSGDPRALASAIARLMTDPGRRVRLARQARRLVEREFDADRQAALLRAGFPQRPPALAGTPDQ